MRELPILMNGAMVRAVLDGRKTVTRRLVKPVGAVAITTFIGANNQPTGEFGWCPHERLITEHIRPPYQVGDRLYVRETSFRMPHPADVGLTPNDMPRTWQAACEVAGQVLYRADMESRTASLIMSDGERWTPSIHMPKDRARIWLEVTAVRVERLRDITAKQAISEGTHARVRSNGSLVDMREQFSDLWDGLAKPGTRWADNPWVWVVEFKRIEKEVLHVG